MFVVSKPPSRSAPPSRKRGELSAAIELPRRFPGITDNAEALECARTIAGWKPLPSAACQITPVSPSSSRARPTKPWRGS
jgi:hypothetical protein